MHANRLRDALAALLLASTLGAAAQPSAPASPGAVPACELPASDTDPLGDRAGLLERYEHLPQSCLRELFAACGEAARGGLLDFGTAATCSLGYEALLSQGFGGDFRALMAWWRDRRAEAALQ